MVSEYTRFLEEGGTVQTIGGKGASLAVLRGAGFPVPEGFCVTVDGYRTFLESGGLEEALTLGVIRSDASDLRAAQSEASDSTTRMTHTT